jgi:uncharacterized protein DUF6916
MNERRAFLMQTTVALVAVGLGWRTLPAAVAGQRATSAPMSDQFRKFVNQSFTFRALRSDVRVPVQLVAVKQKAPAPGLDQFSLLFRGRPGSHLREGFYEVAGGPAGRSEIFLTPIPGGSRETYYRADFSLLA